MTARDEDPRVTAALDDLRAWSDALPTYDVEAGAARHVELVRDGATASTGALARASSKGWWIAGASAAIVLGLLGAWPREQSVSAATSATPEAVVDPPHVEEPVRAVEAEPEPPPPPEVDAEAAIPSSAPEPARVRSEKRKPSRPEAVADPHPEDAAAATLEPEPDALERELAIVRRMRHALNDDPSRVLTLAEQADREIGRGVFTEERAALRVFALARLDDARADQAAAAFLREFAGGPFAARVASLREAPAREAQ